MESEKLRALKAEKYSEEFETKLIQLATYVTQLKDQHALELDQLKQTLSASKQGGSSDALKEAQKQALMHSEGEKLAQQRVIQLESDLEKESFNNSELEKKVSELQLVNDGIQVRFLKLAEISKNLREKNQELINKIDQTKPEVNSAQFKSLEGQINDLKFKLSSASESEKTLTKKLSDYESNNKILKNEVENLQVKLKALETIKSNPSVSSSAELNAELSQTRLQRDQALSEVKALNQKFQTEIIPKITLERQNNQAEILKLKENVDKLEKENSGLKNVSETNKNEFESSNKKLKQVEVSLKESTANYTKLSLELQSSKNLITQLKEDFNNQKLLSLTMEDQLNSKSDSSNSNSKILEMIKSENESLKERLKNSESKLNLLKEEIIQLRENLSNASTSVETILYTSEDNKIEPQISVPVSGGPPPPPPPPAFKTSVVSTKSTPLKKTTQISSPNSTSDIVGAINQGIKLKKSKGPEPVDEKLKRLESQKKAEKGPSGNPVADFASLGMMAKQLALQRTARMEAKKDNPDIKGRQSVVLNDMLKNNGNF